MDRLTADQTKWAHVHSTNTTPELTVRSPAIWNIQMAFLSPDKVTSVGIVTLELHL